jgi:hypothetical protein
MIWKPCESGQAIKHGKLEKLKSLKLKYKTLEHAGRFTCEHLLLHLQLFSFSGIPCFIEEAHTASSEAVVATEFTILTII